MASSVYNLLPDSKSLTPLRYLNNALGTHQSAKENDHDLSDINGISQLSQYWT